MSRNNWDRVKRENRQKQWATNHRSEAAEIRRHHIHGRPTADDESLIAQRRKNQPGKKIAASQPAQPAAQTPTPPKQIDPFSQIWAGHCQLNGCDKVWACAVGLWDGVDRRRWVGIHCYGRRYGTLKPERYFYSELGQALKHFEEKVARKQGQSDRYSAVSTKESGMLSFLTREYKIIKKEKGIH